MGCLLRTLAMWHCRAALNNLSFLTLLLYHRSPGSARAPWSCEEELHALRLAPGGCTLCDHRYINYATTRPLGPSFPPSWPCGCPNSTRVS
jgi:hypothetical protein